MPRERVSNEPFREAFLRSTTTASDIARAVGWFSTNGAPDGPRVTRALGLSNTSVSTSKGGGSQVRKSISYETALLLAEALCLDPYEAGI